MQFVLQCGQNNAQEELIVCEKRAHGKETKTMTGKKCEMTSNVATVKFQFVSILVAFFVSTQKKKLNL